MTVLEYILNGLEAELALERELGIRVVECDRSLLTPKAAPPAAAVPSRVVPAAAPPPMASPTASPPRVAPPRAPEAGQTHSGAFDFVFLHDRPLSPAGAGMLDKIVAALGKTPETAPCVVSGALPRAKAYIVLGGLALRKWFPGVNAAPGQWVSAAHAPNVLVTYSPAYILRFKTVTDAVKQIKRDMWNSIKSVLRRIQR